MWDRSASLISNTRGSESWKKEPGNVSDITVHLDNVALRLQWLSLVYLLLIWPASTAVWKHKNYWISAYPYKEKESDTLNVAVNKNWKLESCKAPIHANERRKYLRPISRPRDHGLKQWQTSEWPSSDFKCNVLVYINFPIISQLEEKIMS